MKALKIWYSNDILDLKGRVTGSYVSTKKIVFSLASFLALVAVTIAIGKIYNDKPVDAGVLATIIGFAVSAAGWYTYGKTTENN